MDRNRSRLGGGFFVDNESKDNKDRTYYQSRIAKRNFKVSYAIPIQYDLSEVAASFEDGILKVVLPKRLESMKKQIELR